MLRRKHSFFLTIAYLISILKEILHGLITLSNFIFGFILEHVRFALPLRGRLSSLPAPRMVVDKVQDLLGALMAKKKKHISNGVRDSFYLLLFNLKKGCS